MGVETSIPSCFTAYVYVYLLFTLIQKQKPQQLIHWAVKGIKKECFTVSSF